MGEGRNWTKTYILENLKCHKATLKQKILALQESEYLSFKNYKFFPWKTAALAKFSYIFVLPCKWTKFNCFFSYCWPESAFSFH